MVEAREPAARAAWLVLVVVLPEVEATRATHLLVRPPRVGIRRLEEAVPMKAGNSFTFQRRCPKRR